MNRSYTNTQKRTALRVYKRTQSVTKTVRELGYPGRWTLYKWLREPKTPPQPRKQAKTLTHYPYEVKLRAVELFHNGWRPADIAQECCLHTHASVYAWAQRYRKEGQWGLMSKKERAGHGRIPTKAALEKSLPDNPTQLKQQMATLLVEKAVLEKELEIIKKT
ncbi:IS3 family transposase [Corynebacterium diphtheriae]|nr:IS3 family transposase [Corynebacterium diphtheriae]CAB0717061.1 IS3 family transposase [Corynebacterium diphtheriae]CAB0717068.1 IS3 family transposase [Corynebacterium diphtheriae]CAB0764876.1 IS3 family transposase [Corynebacterium diphtheriae]